MKKVFSLVVSLLLFAAVSGYAGEPAKSASDDSVSGELKSALEKFVQDEVTKTESYKVNDKKEKGVWVLTFVKVNTIKKLDDEHYSVLAKLNGYLEQSGNKTKEGKLEIQFYVAKKDDKLNLTTATIYKIDGKVRQSDFICTVHKEIENWEPIDCPICGKKMELCPCAR